MSATRTEKDPLGELQVPAAALYGVQTMRALQNFPISGLLPLEPFVIAQVWIKKAAAMTHRETGRLDAMRADAIIAAAERAVKRKLPLVLFAAAGGARMQEGILSLMQMPRTTVAVQMLKEAGLPYIVVLTHPTTGGVTASYAMLGDVQIAEPNALICFAGPRVIEQTIREKLPEGFQRAEYLLDHGMLDRVTHRKKLREELVTIIRMLTRQSPAVRGELSAPKPETGKAELAAVK